MGMTRRTILLFVLAIAGCDSHSVGMSQPTLDASTLDAPSTTAPDAVGEGPTGRAAIMLDDFEGGGEIPTMWLLNRSPGAALTVTPPSPARGESSQALHVTLAATGADVFTHHHFDWTQMFSGVRFWVRGDAPGGAELAVAVTGSVSETHGEALAAGRPWLLAAVPVGPEWTQATVGFGTLLPEGPGTPQGTFGAGVSVLHFLVKDGGAGGVWLDDIELLCVSADCNATP